MQRVGMIVVFFVLAAALLEAAFPGSVSNSLARLEQSRPQVRPISTSALE